MEVLYLDVGNTRIKYLFREKFGFLEDLVSVSDFIETNGVTALCFATVAGNRLDIIDLCKSRAIPYMEGVVSAEVFGMRVAYNEPSKLGIDRWLAMFSAFSDYPSQYVAVVDAGTALKIDIINSNGVHLGGSISMGLSLSYSTLYRNTAQLPHVKEQFDGKLGKNTEGCINYGVIMSAIAIIEKTIRELDRKCCVILTGGDADVISSYLNLEHCVTDNLTLKGLRLLSERGFIKT